MYVVLPEWTGLVVAILHRYGITRDELAMRSGISSTYLSKLLNDPEPSRTTCAKVEEGLRKCMEKRGFTLGSISSKPRPHQSNDESAHR